MHWNENVILTTSRAAEDENFVKVSDFSVSMTTRSYRYCSVLYTDITVKPVCNDHLSNKIYYLWFIQ